jgi:hypothetical protein
VVGFAATGHGDIELLTSGSVGNDSLGDVGGGFWTRRATAVHTRCLRSVLEGNYFLFCSNIYSNIFYSEQLLTDFGDVSARMSCIRNES